jgi:hypothetical protein
MRTLLLCHTRKDDVMGCASSEIPITQDNMREVESLDIEEGGDWRADWTKALEGEKARRMKGRYDIVTPWCCVYKVFFSWTTCVNKRAVENTVHVLKPGGVFIIKAPIYGYAMVEASDKRDVKGVREREEAMGKMLKRIQGGRGGEAMMRRLDGVIMGAVEKASRGAMRRVTGEEYMREMREIYKGAMRHRYVEGMIRPAEETHALMFKREKTSRAPIGLRAS